MDYKIKSRIWIEADGNTLLGEGRVSLLKAIDKEGSLTKAAKSLGMSYKKAWNLIDTVNNRAKEPVVIKSTGGKGGGGAILTAHGKHLINTFETINKSCWQFLDNEALKNKFS